MGKVRQCGDHLFPTPNTIIVYAEKVIKPSLPDVWSPRPTAHPQVGRARVELAMTDTVRAALTATECERQVRWLSAYLVSFFLGRIWGAEKDCASSHDTTRGKQIFSRTQHLECISEWASWRSADPSSLPHRNSYFGMTARTTATDGLIDQSLLVRGISRLSHNSQIDFTTEAVTLSSFYSILAKLDCWDQWPQPPCQSKLENDKGSLFSGSNT